MVVVGFQGSPGYSGDRFTVAIVVATMGEKMLLMQLMWWLLQSWRSHIKTWHSFVFLLMLLRLVSLL